MKYCLSQQVLKAEKSACCKPALPSHLRSEAYGMVLVEASMFGKPMVTCEIGTDTSFVNQHLETGFVVSPESPDELSQAMNALLTDSDLAKRLGKAARIRYETHFSGPVLRQAYTNLYRQVMEQSA